MPVAPEARAENIFDVITHGVARRENGFLQYEHETG